MTQQTTNMRLIGFMDIDADQIDEIRRQQQARIKPEPPRINMPHWVESEAGDVVLEGQVVKR